MSILHIPVLKKKGASVFDESIPSVLFGRVSEKEWQEIIKRMNAYLSMRRDRLIFKMLGPFVIGNVLRSITQFFIDRKVKEYLDKKNLVLSHCGVHIHHPAERMYAGMDLSIHSVVPDGL